MKEQILVPVDFSEQSVIALEQACSIARKADLDITLLYVIHRNNPQFTDLKGIVHKEIAKEEGIEKVILEKLKNIVNEFSEKFGINFDTIIEKGHPYQIILDNAKKMKPRFLAMGANSSPKEGRRNMGSTTLKVLRETDLPIFTINGKQHTNGCRNIILPLDATKETRQKVGKAIEIAKYYDATIKIVSVLTTTDRFIINKVKSQVNQVKLFIENKEVKCETSVIEKNKDSLAKSIVRYAVENNGDLIIIMTQPEDGFINLFVNTLSQDIINISEIPILSIAPKRIGEVIIGGM
ncbi:MAG: universal stress protein [Bacteroidota bacterium]|nr:universal stress protein [Bacteroidota bacterium]